MPPNLAITGPVSIGDLLDRTFRVLRARFGVLTLTVGVVLVPMGLLMGLATGRFMVGYMGFLDAMIAAAEEPDPADLGFFVGTLAGYLGVILLLAVVNLLAINLANLAVVYHVHHFLHGELLTVTQGLAAAWRRLLPLIGMLLLQGLAIGAMTLVAIMVVAIGVGGAAVLLGGFGALTGDESLAGTLAFIGVILVVLIGYLIAILVAVIPAAYLGTRWAAGISSLALEKLGPVAALRRSWQLTRKRFFRTFGFLALLTVLRLLVISLPVAVFQQLALLVLPAQMELAIAASTSVSYLVNIIWQPLFAAGLVLLYYDLRVRAEAYDLNLRVAQLEAVVAQERPDA